MQSITDLTECSDCRPGAAGAPKTPSTPKTPSAPKAPSAPGPADLDLNDPEAVCFTLIAHAGEARSAAFEALEHAKKGDLSGARRLMDGSKQAILAAHHVQTALLAREARGVSMPVGVLLVHAQDHLMCAMLARELAEQLIELYRVRAS